MSNTTQQLNQAVDIIEDLIHVVDRLQVFAPPALWNSTDTSDRVDKEALLRSEVIANAAQHFVDTLRDAERSAS